MANLTKLFGMTFLVGKFKFKLLFHGPKWLSKILLQSGKIIESILFLNERDLNETSRNPRKVDGNYHRRNGCFPGAVFCWLRTSDNELTVAILRTPKHPYYTGSNSPLLTGGSIWGFLG